VFINICRLFLLILVLTASLPIRAQDLHEQDFDAQLDRLHKLTHSATSAQVRQLIEDMQSALDTVNAAQRARFRMLKARAAAVARRDQEAMALLNELLDQRDRLAVELELRVLTLAANLLIIGNQFEAGFQYYREALELTPEVKSAQPRADTWNVAADFHARIGEYATAVEYANRAMDELDPSVSPRTHCIALERRARALESMNQAQAAIQDYRNAMALCDAIPDNVFAGLVRVGLARALGDDGDRQPLLEQAIKLLALSEFRDGELAARTLLAEVMLEQRRTDQAREVIEPAVTWVNRRANEVMPSAAFKNVQARLARTEGDNDAIYKHTRKAIELEQQQAQRVRRMRLTMLMSAYDDAARETEVELLRARNAMAGLDSEAHRQQDLALTYGGFGVVAAGILLTGLLIKTARERRRLQRLSQRDDLTGLFNHTRFFELAQQAFQRARQSAMPFALIVADVDLFKQVNDEFGHLVGDSVLARVGARLRAAFGSDAIIGRLGGEEFGVALPDCDIDSAVARIEHLRATLNRRRADDQEPAITMSFGVAELNREPTLDALYAHADQALYDAKDAGRNRVITVARIDLDGAEFLT